MRIFPIIFIILIAAGCNHATSVNKGNECFEAGGKAVSCEPFLSKLQEHEITASISLSEGSFEINAVTLPSGDQNFVCGLTPQPGKRYHYYFSEHSLVVETDGKILKFQKENTAIGSVLGQWVCYASNDRLLSAAHINFLNNNTLRIHQLCR